MKNYRPPNPSHWQGRNTSPENGSQYWYQHVELSDIHRYAFEPAPDYGLVGYACEVGVARNQGRKGAKAGPTAIRQKAGRLTLHTQSSVTDFGDAYCEDDNVLDCQKTFASIISTLLSNGTFPIALGGGHDIALAHFQGIKSAFPDKKIGIINFDAHFDLRPVETLPNSGTPFNQILSTHQDTQYLAIGIQTPANTQKLFDIAHKHGVKYILAEESELPYLRVIEQMIDAFTDEVDVLYVTIDLDGISSAYAPGVSAPSPMGFSPHFLFACLTHLINSGKVSSLDIAELNPTYDQDALTASLSAHIIEHVVRMRG